MLAYDSVCIYLYEVSLHVTSPPRQVPENGGFNQPQSSTALTNLLVGCLEATKTFLDNYLELPAHVVERHSMLEKGYLSHAIVVLIKIAFSTTPGIESLQMRKACNVTYYLDALARLARTIGGISSETAEADHRDSFWQFYEISMRIKAWYERMNILGQDGTTSDLKGMSLLQLAEITKDELPIDWDLGDIDFTFLEGTNLWE
ncbi:hypothetical protein MMC28_008726 [Mycoblastus sanguinarius]|nr:hypothetical protein [Mycoblastus sanguinarius]